MPRVRVGDTVVLNDNGLESIFGGTHGLSHMKTKRMKVTHVDPESITHPEQTHIIQVDDPEINHYLINDCDFDVVRN